MSVQTVAELIAHIRAEAEVLRRWGALPQAVAAEHVAERLRETALAWELEELTLGDAAAESGYSQAHLRRLVHEGRVENAGEGHRIKVRRCNLPRKARSGSQQASTQEPDLAGEVLRARGLDTP